jgi:lysozyme
MTRHLPAGIDVSDNNGDFNWRSWNGHVQFAMIKASEGPTAEFPEGYRDVQFTRNWEESKDIKIHRIPYHYCRPDKDPAAQAKYFAETLNGRHEGVLAVDFEEEGSMSIPDVAFWGWVFCYELAKLHPHVRVLVYTYPCFAEQGYCAKLGVYPLWIANYDVPSPAIPGPWKQWTFWQNTGRTLDMDVFNGTDKELEDFCAFK